jgi:hypothetical protein
MCEEACATGRNCERKRRRRGAIPPLVNLHMEFRPEWGNPPGTDD